MSESDIVVYETIPDIRDHLNGWPVKLSNGLGRWTIDAGNVGSSTAIDIFDLLNWLRDNRPDLLGKCGLAGECGSQSEYVEPILGDMRDI